MMTNLSLWKAHLRECRLKFGTIEAGPLASAIEILKEHPLHLVDELRDALVVIIYRKVVEIPIHDTRNVLDKTSLVSIPADVLLNISQFLPKTNGASSEFYPPEALASLSTH